jgi:cytochrome c-type biogenesis protein CcmE
VKAKHQRLSLVGLFVLAIGGAAAFGLSAMGDRATYFYAPSDVDKNGVEAGKAIRFGGLVVPGSIQREGTTLKFEVTDNGATKPVRYAGIIPDLFREGQGVIAEGSFDASGTFIATTLLAKHDENYMPPEVADAIHKTRGKVE